MDSATIHWTFVAYLLAMLLIGLAGFRGTRDLSDYLLGGRRLGHWVTALSAGASDMSGWLLLGLPGYAYLAGMEAGWIALGLFAGTWLNWRLVAERLRLETERTGNAITIPEFLANRFGDRTNLLRGISALFILLFFTFYTSSGLVAGGKLFHTVFGMPYHLAVITGALVIVLYTFLGGFLAVCWTDVVQGLLMLFALILVPLMAIADLAAGEGLITSIRNSNPELLDPLTSPTGEPLGVVAILSLLGWGLGYFGQPHILARFMAIRHPHAIPRARRIAVIWIFLSLAGAVLVGLAGIAYPGMTLEGPESETVFMRLVIALFHPAMAGILLAAILAAVMSTADSQLLVASSALTKDFYRVLWGRHAGERQLVWVGRFAVLMIALIAGVLALEPDSKVLDLVAYAWAGFGAAFGPTLLLTLYWSGMRRSGALAGIITGGLTVILWKQLPPEWSGLYEIIPGFLLSGLAALIFSILEKRRTV